LVDDYYGGMTHPKVVIKSDTSFFADKFQPNNLSEGEEWTYEMRDFRYHDYDEVNLFTMIENKKHKIKWKNLYYQKLQAVSTAASLMLATTIIAALSI
jgi:hypothetical protein